MAWIASWLGLSETQRDESPPQEQVEEDEDLVREQEQLNLIARRGGEATVSVPSLPTPLPSVARRRSGLVLPCLCCPPSPALASPMWTEGRCRRLSPTWEQFEGGLVVVLLTALAWGLLWVIIGDVAGPLSAPFYVMVLSLAGHGLGALVGALTPLAPLFGMLLLPAIAGNLGTRELDVLADLRGDTGAVLVFAFVSVFIARSGVDVDLADLQSSSGLVLALAFLPLLAEAAVVTFVATYALDISWRWGFLLGALSAPMSPLIVMWSALRAGGHLCSLLLVVAALDMAAAFSLLLIAMQCALHAESWNMIMLALLQLVGGLLFGAVIGFFFIYVPNEYNVHATFYRVEMMLAMNVFNVIMFHFFLQLPAIGYLATFTAACVASNGWKTLSMETKKDTLRTMMSLGWFVAQPLAMAIVGPHILVAHLGDWRALRYIGVLIVGILVRFGVSFFCCSDSERNWKERLFICVACLPKGTVQLVSCRWMLFHTFVAEEDAAMAKVVLDCCVLALLLTGPLCSVLASLLADALLAGSDSAAASAAPSATPSDGLPAEQRRRVDERQEVTTAS